jgi:hypothetical protein
MGYGHSVAPFDSVLVSVSHPISHTCGEDVNLTFIYKE